MGQKINPVSLRLGINRPWNSDWFSSHHYSHLLHEDIQIRKYLEAVYEKTGLLIGDCKIQRSVNNCSIELALAKPTDLFGEKEDKIKFNRDKVNIEKIKETLEKITNSSIYLSLRETNIYENATFLAKDIAKKMENRLPYAVVLKKTMKYALSSGTINGIKISCSGRLNGEDIARTEWIKEGEIPLHTIKANIDYGYAAAYTIYGVCGIKVWISKKSL